MRHARFITFEGGEGAGKSTQAGLLAADLRAEGHDVLLTREPGGTGGAEVLRGLLLDREASWSSSAEILLHFAARADHVENAIVPWLEKGGWVVCDRFSCSTMAYQGYGQGASRGLIGALTGLMPVSPATTFVLDVSPATRSARLASRAAATDRYEMQDDAFHERVATGFRAIAEQEPGRCVVIAAEADVQAVHESILTVARQRFGLDLLALPLSLDSHR